MDCFYAAVHMRDDPSLRGRPVIIGGDPAGRGVVAAASYEVRRFGVHSAMSSAEARRRCPQAVFLKPEFPRYRRESEAIFALFREVTPVVQAVSIDEGYLDVTDHLEGFGSATGVAREIRRRVLAERGLTVSVGVAPNKLVAKIASDHGKPDGLVVVRPGRVAEFLAPLPVRRLHGVGPATERALGELGVATVADLGRVPLDILTTRFGRHGGVLYEFARGIDGRPVDTRRVRKSLGTENTYRRDLTQLEEMRAEVRRMAAEVAESLERRELAGRTVTLKVRYDDFTTVTRSRTLAGPTAHAGVVAASATDLLAATDAHRRPVRLLGVTVSNLAGGAVWQLPLFEEAEEESLKAAESGTPGR